MTRNAAALLFACAMLAACGGAAPPTPTAVPSNPTQPPTAVPQPTATPVPEPTVTSVPVDRETYDLLASLEAPSADPEDLARRLGDLDQDVPAVLAEEAGPVPVGTVERFTLTNSFTNQNYEIDATLRYVTDHAYVWVDNEAQYDQPAVARLGDVFENRIYQPTRSFFGSEWTPGIDGDPHVYILYGRGAGINVAGYFSSVDSLHPLVREDSNGHEMFVLNADTVDLDDEFTYGVLAHEFQHMIHWNIDRDESSWMNEGLSELAAFMNGFGSLGFHTAYTDNTDLQLNDWPNSEGRAPNYGAASIYAKYFVDRHGEELTQALVNERANGLAGIDNVLAAGGITDPLTGEPVTTEDTVLDWGITNYLNDPDVMDGRFAYSLFADFRRTNQTRTLTDCDEPVELSVHQYAVHYIRMICPGQRDVVFEGNIETAVLPSDPYSGAYAFWSGKGDHSDMRLTQTFDFTGVDDEILMTYQTWYDIEEDWDYAYVLASEDGEKWDFIETATGTDTNPTGNSYGWGYTGVTRGGDWIEETVDLSEYAGKEVTLRFEYVTDASVFGNGMMVDDISIPAIAYFSDFENGDGGWEAEGWARIKNVLPQAFRLAWLDMSTDPVTVEYLKTGVNNINRIPMDIAEEDGGARVLVIVPTTRFTRELASYTLSFE